MVGTPSDWQTPPPQTKLNMYGKIVGEARNRIESSGYLKLNLDLDLTSSRVLKPS